MKKLLLFFLFITFSSIIVAQKDTTGVSFNNNQKYSISEVQNINLNIYPVPVRDNNFTIKCDKEISYIRITNIIGQDIYKMKYNTPQTISKIVLDNPQRGMYIVTIAFVDMSRIVRKIMIEGYN
jgi:hypothetical protein